MFLRRKRFLEIGVQCSRRGSSEVMPDHRVRTSGSRPSEPGRDRAHLPGAVKGWWEVEGGGSAGAEGTRAEPQPSFGSVPREGSLCRHRRPVRKTVGGLSRLCESWGWGEGPEPGAGVSAPAGPSLHRSALPFPEIGVKTERHSLPSPTNSSPSVCPAAARTASCNSSSPAFQRSLPERPLRINSGPRTNAASQEKVFFPGARQTFEMLER